MNVDGPNLTNSKRHHITKQNKATKNEYQAEGKMRIWNSLCSIILFSFEKLNNKTALIHAFEMVFFNF